MRSAMPTRPRRPVVRAAFVVEAVAAVDDLRQQARLAGGHDDRRTLGAAVPRDVRERLLHDAQERDPLRRRAAIEVAGQPRLDVHAVRRSAGGLVLQQLGERAAHECRRIHRPCQIPELTLGRGEHRERVVEARRDELRRSLRRLQLEQSKLRAERGELLERSVVEVEAKPREEALPYLSGDALVFPGRRLHVRAHRRFVPAD